MESGGNDIIGVFHPWMIFHPWIHIRRKSSDSCLGRGLSRNMDMYFVCFVSLHWSATLLTQPKCNLSHPAMSLASQSHESQSFAQPQGQPTGRLTSLPGRRSGEAAKLQPPFEDLDMDDMGKDVRPKRPQVLVIFFATYYTLHIITYISIQLYGSLLLFTHFFGSPF